MTVVANKSTIYTVGEAAVDEFLCEIFTSRLPSLPGLQCATCDKTYKSVVRLNRHQEKVHQVSQSQPSEPSYDDEVFKHIYLLKLLLLKKNIDLYISQQTYKKKNFCLLFYLLKFNNKNCPLR